jgi:two-component sensor histidine kinase
VTSRPARVLYIDDDAGLARLVEKALRARGFDFEHAASGDAGLQRLQTEQFDIVGLDHHMPGHTGLEILPRIQELPNAPPVVYVTGSEDSRVAVAALKAGAIDYVWKDVQGHFRELLVESVITSLAKEKLRRDKEAADREVLAARDRAELLLREVNHRVANSLAIVAGLARMQRAMVTDEAAKHVINEMEARILAVAGVHKRLYTSQDVQTVDVKAYLTGLVEELSAAMQAWGSNHNIKLQAEPMTLPTDKAVSLGIIVTELVTNAYKYAYTGNQAGDIRVSMNRVGSQACLSVEDDGVGWSRSDPATGTGLGTRVIKAMSTNFGAEITYPPTARGTKAMLCFDLEIL